MTILQRYIGSTVLWSITMVFLIFIGLEIFITFIQELSDIGSGDYGIMQAFIYVMKLTPNQLYQLFPISGLLGTLIGLGLLASHHELTVMRVSGVSILQITWSVMRVAIIVMIAATLMGEVLGPSLQYQADMHKEIAKSGGQALATASGVWVRAGDSYILIGEVLGRKQLRDVTVYQVAGDHQFKKIFMAKRVNYEKGHWVMYDISESIITLHKVTSKKIAKQIWHVDLKPELFNVGFDDPNEMNLIKLYHYIQYRQQNGLQVSRYQLAFWKRLYQPLATLVMMFLAIPFVFFGSMRTMTMGLRIIFGIMMGLSFFILNELLGQLSIVFQISAPLAALFPIVLFAGIGFLLVRKA